MGDREARTQDALVCGHTGAAEDAASRRPARPDGTSVIVNRVLNATVARVAERVQAESDEPGCDDAEQERAVGVVGELRQRAVEADRLVRIENRLGLRE